MLRPGDALYLPRGYLHSAVAQGEVSIHLTVGVHPLTAYDLARELIAAAAADRELRRSLPLGLDVTDLDAVTDQVRAAAKRLAAAVDGADQDQLAVVARSVGKRQAGETRPAPLAPLAQLAALRALRADTPLRLRRGLRPVLREAGQRVVLDVMDSAISWPAQVGRPCSSWCATTCSDQPTSPALDPDEQLVVARRLLREGVVVPATSGVLPVEPGGARGD